MKKLITLLAATSLMASSFVFANQTSNPNDVLQQIPNNGGTMNIADAGTTTSPAAEETSATAQAPHAKHVRHHCTKHHCKKHHCKKHSCKKPHQKHKRHHKATTSAPAPAPAPAPAAAEQQPAAQKMSSAAPQAEPKAPTVTASAEPTEIVIGPESSAT